MDRERVEELIVELMQDGEIEMAQEVARCVGWEEEEIQQLLTTS